MPIQFKNELFTEKQKTGKEGGMEWGRAGKRQTQKWIQRNGKNKHRGSNLTREIERKGKGKKQEW